jgi:cysteine desulfurase
MEIYLDHNATSLPDPEAIKLMANAYSDCYGNPSSIHKFGRKAKAQYLKAKDLIAHYFGLTSKELFFVSSATEALNWLLLHKPYKHIISSDIEHSAIYNTLKILEKKGTKVTFLHPGIKGAVSLDDVKSGLCKDTDCIILGAANSETGLIQDTKEIGALAKSLNIPLYVDLVGLIGRGVFNADPNVTAYVFSSHKIHGPKGIAALIHRNPKELNPLNYGGHQESGKKAGTENVPHALAFAYAFKTCFEKNQDFEEISSKRDYFEALLAQELELDIIGKNFPRVSNTSNICFHDISGETLLQLLDTHHVYASHGSACSAGALEPSRILIHMDLGFNKAKSSIRFSFSKFTTQQEIEHSVDVIINIIKEMKILISK